jgi:hypothetical protein
VGLFNSAMYGSLENIVNQIPHTYKQDQCDVIQFLGWKGCQPAEIDQWMQAIYTNACVKNNKKWLVQMYNNARPQVVNTMKTKV